MTIDPKISITALAKISLDAATAKGINRLGITTGDITLPADTDQVATLSLTLAAAADVDINFATFAKDGGAAATDAEGAAIDFEKIYALGIKASADLSVSTAGGEDPWVQAPLPATAATLRSLCAVGSFAFGAGSNSALFANPGEESATLEIIAIGHKA